MQESEGLEIPPNVSLEGVTTLLNTPSKGHFYVVRVRPYLELIYTYRERNSLRLAAYVTNLLRTAPTFHHRRGIIHCYDHQVKS
jgi:hypothetical protein